MRVGVEGEGVTVAVVGAITITRGVPPTTTDIKVAVPKGSLRRIPQGEGIPPPTPPIPQSLAPLAPLAQLV